ncbi:MAG: tRNA epoxyqueuosine(34) reductase QueG [Verrucomicrobiota bacterium]|nr:tRNA epoxyqueuosine(34) reductase QueG [Verrucomicrobiota bacterium]
MKPAVIQPDIKKRIIAKAKQLGFDMIGFAPAEPGKYAEFLNGWLQDGRHGEMTWMGKEPEKRSDPRRIVEGARTVIVLGSNYFLGFDRTKPQRTHVGRVAMYARGDDYHEVITPRVRQLEDWIKDQFGGVTRGYVDTGPVLERPVAAQSGVGWQGKSTMLISKDHGTYFFLSEILTTLDIQPDAPAKDRCGSCEKCITACPTGAITAPYQMDARLCIAYLTIELKGSIPEELRPLIGDRVYGCDDCLQACPWNKFAQMAHEVRFKPRPFLDQLDLLALLKITNEEFSKMFKSSPIKRIKRRGLLRNVCVVLGNVGDSTSLPALQQASADTDPLVVEHALWAIQRIKQRTEAQPNMA